MEEFFEHSEEKAHVGYYVSKLWLASEAVGQLIAGPKAG
jgi:hypothetical protein